MSKQILSADKLFEDIRFVPLETNDSCLLREFVASGNGVYRVLRKNNHFYLADLDRVTVFDYDGKWIYTISHRGNGPGEYVYSGAFAVTDREEIFIWDTGTDNVLVYDKKDIFLTTYRFSDSLRINDIIDMNDSLFMLKSQSGYGNKFHVVHKRTKAVTNSYWPTKRRIFSYGNKYNLPHYRGKLLFNEYQNNSIYELTPDSAVLRYTIDIDGRIPPEGYWEQPDVPWNQLIGAHTAKGYVDNIEFFSESEKHILLRYSGSPESPIRGNAWIDKATDKSVLFDKIAFDRGFIWEPGNIMYAQEDGWIVIPIPADQLLAAKNSSLQNRFPDLSEDDNPILCTVKIR
jgi:hypothetical protein